VVALIVVSGIPGTGKSTLADALAVALGAPVFAKDRIEASLWRSGVTAEHDSWTIAEDLLSTLAGEQLRREQSAILDTVARTSESRDAWRAIAEEYLADFKPIECICSDEAVHRRRIDGRERGIPGWYELTWDDVQRARSLWEPWDIDRLVLDAITPLGENVASAIAYVTV
jgi:predicted kinase